jgi:nucleoside-diphosphate kinase
MAGRITFTIVKPEAVSKEYTGHIFSMISSAGFHIASMKMLRMTREMAEKFYLVHKERPFYKDLVEFMSSGPVVVSVLEKDNAVSDYRALIGATDPTKAVEGTIRKKYAESVQNNAVHGSDSDENAIIESDFFFSKSERYLLKVE